MTTATQPTCQRCGHTWTPRNGTPVACPKCKSYKWNEPLTPRAQQERSEGE